METSLYKPVKAFLEGLGFAVKGEVGGCDVVGVRPGEEPILVIAELKQSFTLELVLQAVDRAPAADEVWLAARLSARGRGREADARFRNLCRRLGFGLLGVTASGKVEVLVDPSAWTPRRDRKRRSRLVAEHERRRGDPSEGGSTRQPIMTAYRQRALLCAAQMRGGPQRPRDLRPRAEDAPQILQRNVYGWFERVGRGLYGLTAAGHAAIARWGSEADAAAPPAAE
ncbi:MAG: DUF2161 family putative PD-(D/E)XK-type phosphodiesterase [Alsobacter sp.]